jgi:hypothetical protein
MYIKLKVTQMFVAKYFVNSAVINLLKIGGKLSEVYFIEIEGNIYDRIRNFEVKY